MTFGKGVSERETWPDVLEERLAERFPGRCVEVLNTGIPNTNFHIQWLHFRARWRQFQPDLVLVGFFVYNDTQEQEADELYFPAWMSFVDANPALKRSAIIQRLYYGAFGRIGEQLVYQEIPRYFEPDYPGWIQFEESLSRLRAAGVQDDFRVAFALVPVPMGYGDYPFEDHHRRLAEYLEGEGVPTIDLLDGLRDVVAADHWVHPSDGHPDPFVHERMADHLASAAPWARWMGDCDSGTEQQASGAERACLDSEGLRKGAYELVGPRRVQATYEAGVLHGYYRESNESAGSAASGAYVDGQRAGAWIVLGRDDEDAGAARWADLGRYERDVRVGPWRRLASRMVDGQLEEREERGSYSDGHREGAWVETVSLRSRESRSRGHYERGDKSGLWTTEEDVHGQWVTIAEGEFEAGVPAGVWRHWTPLPDGRRSLVRMSCHVGAEARVAWTWGEEDEGEQDEDLIPPGDDDSAAEQVVTDLETDCSDGVDDDEDGKTDCEDEDCEADPHCGPTGAEGGAGGDDAVGMGRLRTFDAEGQPVRSKKRFLTPSEAEELPCASP
ncbi:MAG: hypothetical protein CL928_04975 [Deltaproteobacteria bacterium]|nr:hypothetical protein [Deltaproteobacteria bacterium]